MATSINGNQIEDRMIRIKELVNITALSRTTLWRLERASNFPSRKQLSLGAVGWSLLEVEAWMSSRNSIILGGSTAVH